MSAHPEELDPQIITDSQLQQQQQQQPQHPQQPQHQHQHQIQPPPSASPSGSAPRKPKAPSVRRACTACHAGKTRCSEILPCQNCLKRGLASVCTYDETDNRGLDDNTVAAEATAATPFVAPPVYATHVGGMTLNHQQYYDYNGTFTGASSSTFRPAKRPRALTDEETAAITRNFTRGDFFVGNSAPVRIDPRLPVRLTLGEGDHVHFNVGNYDTQS